MKNSVLMFMECISSWTTEAGFDFVIYMINSLVSIKIMETPFGLDFFTLQIYYMHKKKNITLNKGEGKAKKHMTSLNKVF